MSATIIIDDHPLFRGGLRAALESAGGFGTCLEAGSVAEACAAIDKANAGNGCLAIIDINLPDGTGFEVAERYASTSGFRCLMLSMHTDRPMAIKALKLGANGYASKQVDLEVLIAGLRLVSLNQLFIEGEILKDIITPFISMAGKERDALAQLEILNQRERETFLHIVRGHTTKEISAAMGISQRSAENYVSSVYTKLKKSTEAALVCLAIQGRLISPWDD
ncbi:MAG TPA: response regulator transcription factor [Spirochaetales bacterium]|nr:response regulator transcription factor [Spirochaetales bacterium]